MRETNEVVALFAQRGAKLGDCGKMCSECAFKLNSPANLEEQNADAALESLSVPGAVFHCHPQGSYGDAGRVCTGFKYAKQYLESIMGKDYQTQE